MLIMTTDQSRKTMLVKKKKMAMKGFNNNAYKV